MNCSMLSSLIRVPKVHVFGYGYSFTHLFMFVSIVWLVLVWSAQWACFLMALFTHSGGVFVVQ